ncbi:MULTISPECIES: hypothetical protein [Streptomyces]|uniref:Uncharacterized protein n=1 Tax=Streptomyces anulatus TaxID=1892 RepID=A0ABZ1ZJE5_STRAQ|nr:MULTISPECIES: hypothetical protein [Streptomyces]OKJ14405.1 hypothetical protein AMK20_00815 [Streptomyces sp. TSRI0261]QNQ35409.1 hypothetical protein HYC88_17995 [Streptomyces sp. CB00271]QYA95280.1 hypothetical protein KZO11_17270 [Streptomyces anulatus]
MAYRYWCGECTAKTSWLDESRAEQQQIDHYTRKHPGIPPGGHVEVHRGNPQGGLGCLPFLGITIVLLVIAASCRR